MPPIHQSSILSRLVACDRYRGESVSWRNSDDRPGSGLRDLRSTGHVDRARQEHHTSASREKPAAALAAPARRRPRIRGADLQGRKTSTDVASLSVDADVEKDSAPSDAFIAGLATLLAALIAMLNANKKPDESCADASGQTWQVSSGSTCSVQDLGHTKRNRKGNLIRPPSTW